MLRFAEPELMSSRGRGRRSKKAARAMMMAVAGSGMSRMFNLLTRARHTAYSQ